MSEGKIKVGLFEGLWAVSIGKLFAVGSIAMLLLQPGRHGGWCLLVIAIIIEMGEKYWNMKIDESQKGMDDKYV